MTPKRQPSLQVESITEITGKQTMNALEEIKSEILLLNRKLEILTSRLDIITDLLLPEERPELVGHLQETLDTIKILEDEKQGMPISRNDLANVLGVHSNTAYVRAEKLVQKNLIMKFYGRELGLTRFEEKKAVYYSLPHSIYDPNYIEQLKNENEAAYMVCMTLLQQQPLSKDILLRSDKIVAEDIERALQYLLNRGLIVQEIKNKTTQYRIRTIETDE
ncbi:MAG: hypothetical protein ACXABI_05995 [Candidatus Hodarchaeales archaeon]|jgi:predicted HTH transcriptional regulator